MSEAIIRLNAALGGRDSLESELGEGGMATVYLANDIKLERKVALKVLKPELAAAVGAERFLAAREFDQGTPVYVQDLTAAQLREALGLR